MYLEKQLAPESGLCKDDVKLSLLALPRTVPFYTPQHTVLAQGSVCASIKNDRIFFI